jgi:alkylation response protein AidB-like acyl-CoA dehydrogenase
MTDYIELPLTGLETPLNEVEAAIQASCHRFAADVLRPVGEQLDRMTPEAAVATSSPLWEVLEQSKDLGISLLALTDLPPLERVRLLMLASEELSWGDAGMGGIILVNHFPVMFSMLAGNMAMAEFCDGQRGCWAITEPDHGSDILDPSGATLAPGGVYGRPNCIARIDGGDVVINGQKSAWVSGALSAEVCVLFCHTEVEGNTQPGLAVIVPLDTPGVSRGKPLDKMGLRPLNQGELFFDNVRVPRENLLCEPEGYNELSYRMLSEANPHVALMFVGLARSAYERAVQYAHERRAGGVPIIQHQNVRYRLFHMFRKIEAARALVRRAMEYNATAPRPALHGSAAAKVTATQTGFEVASEALQIFGGNGMTREYPMEKLLRDARAGMIADGCNEFLALKGGSMLVNPGLL